jgi:hypothetical protein
MARGNMMELPILERVAKEQDGVLVAPWYSNEFIIEATKGKRVIIVPNRMSPYDEMGTLICNSKAPWIAATPDAFKGVDVSPAELMEAMENWNLDAAVKFKGKITLVEAKAIEPWFEDDWEVDGMPARYALQIYWQSLATA